jgi:hypothetical protein
MPVLYSRAAVPGRTLRHLGYPIFLNLPYLPKGAKRGQGTVVGAKHTVVAAKQRRPGTEAGMAARRAGLVYLSGCCNGGAAMIQHRPRTASTLRRATARVNPDANQ